MDAIWAAMITPPTAVYTGLLAVFVLYWLVVALGALDLESFDGSHEHGMFEFLTLDRVPVSLIATCVVLLSWFLCLIGETQVRPLVGDAMPRWLFSGALGFAALVAGTVASAFLLRPLKPLFRLTSEHSHEHLVDKQVTVTSSTVDQRFGTAIYATVGPDVLLNVICQPQHTLVKGDPAVVVEYDAARDLYVIAPLRHLRPGFVGTGDESTDPAVVSRPSDAHGEDLSAKPIAIAPRARDRETPN